jgi:hypothetical protein
MVGVVVVIIRNLHEVEILIWDCFSVAEVLQASGVPPPAVGCGRPTPKAFKEFSQIDILQALGFPADQGEETIPVHNDEKRTIFRKDSSCPVWDPFNRAPRLLTLEEIKLYRTRFFIKLVGSLDTIYAGIRE